MFYRPSGKINTMDRITMNAADFEGLTLASLQDTISNELREDLRSDRKREFAACAARVLARLRTDADAAPALAAERLEQWRRLSTEPVDPNLAVDELHAHARQIGNALTQRSADPAFIEDLRTPDSTSAAWFREAVSATRDYLEAYEQAVPKPSAKIETAAVDPDAMRQRLSRYLRSRFPGLPEDPVLSFRVVPGGRGKQTALFTLAPNDLLPTRLVLRLDLALSVTGTSVYAEYPLLKAVEALGLPVPSPIAAEQDPAHLGGSFIIVSEVVDAKVGGEFFAELNELSKLDASFAPDIAQALARLHRLREHPSGTGLGGHASGGSDPLDMVRGFQQMFRGIARKPPLHLASELGFAWLLANPLPATRPRRLVHGDVGLHNVMLRGGKLAAILDWELTHLGDPAEDIAYAWSPLLRHLMSWDDFKKIYTDNGGDAEACDAHAVAWYSVWAHTRNSVYVTMHYDWAASGQRKDIECFSAGVDFFARTQAYIARELDEALRKA